MRRWLIPIGLGLAAILIALVVACSSAPVPPPAEGAAVPPARPPAADAGPQASTPPALLLRPLAFSQLGGWAGDRHDEALAAFVRSCAKAPPVRPNEAGLRRPVELAAPAYDWSQACA
ncbi:MAG: hypothetical protein WAS73_05645, partial [Defluviicoccus sp.]